MFKKLLHTSIILVLIVVILGAYTRLSDAGLGCPDWPGCYGKLIVPDVASDAYSRPLEHGKAWKEMIHRYAASILGLVILALFFLAYKKKPLRPQTIALPAFLVFMVSFQGALGMWTVTKLVHPGIVSMHLIGGFITAALLAWLLFNQVLTYKPQKKIDHKHTKLLYFSLIVLSVQIFLGGWTSTNYAALSCGSDFPTCLGQWWPTTDFNNAFYWGEIGIDYEFGVLENTARTTIQMTHRVGALVITGLLIALLFAFKQYQYLSVNLKIIAALLLLQVSLGILNVVLSLPITIAVLHNAVALLLLISLLALIHRTVKTPNH